MNIKPFCFTYELKPKPIYLLKDLINLYSDLNQEERDIKIENLWVKNDTIIVLDNRTILNEKINEEVNELEKIEELISTLENMRNE